MCHRIQRVPCSIDALLSLGDLTIKKSLLGLLNYPLLKHFTFTCRALRKGFYQQLPTTVHTHSGGGVTHAGRQPAGQELSGGGVSLRDTSTLIQEEPGIELATFRLQVNPLNLLSSVNLRYNVPIEGRRVGRTQWILCLCGRCYEGIKYKCSIKYLYGNIFTNSCNDAKHIDSKRQKSYIANVHIFSYRQS